MQKQEDIENIKKELRSMGACNLVDNIRGWKSLAAMIQKPQGVEFIANHDDEHLIAMFREYGHHVRQYGIYVDCGNIHRNRLQHAAFVGDSQAAVHCHGTTEAFTFIVMAGAQLTVHASSYAVIRIYNLGGEVSVTNDGTARIL